jgi:amidase
VGSVPRDGMVPISTSQDSPGPMGRSVRDVALLLEVLMAKTGFVDAAANQDELRIGVVREWLTKHDAANALFEESVQKLANAGINLVEINVPTPKESVSDEEFQVLMYELKTDLGRYLKARPGDGVKSLEDVVKFNLAHADQEMQYFKQEIFDQAVQLGGRSKVYQKIRDRNLAWAQATLTKAFDGVDVLIGATYAPAWVSALGQGDDFSTASSITLAPSIAGTPIGALPMGLVDGLPVGMGVLSRQNDEMNLVRAMARIEAIFGLGILVPTFRK